MNGIITKFATGLCLGIILVPVVGCTCYRDLVDPCWPERYNGMARHSVREMTFAQADKGHMLEQTVWNWMFDTDPKTGAPTDRLSSAGIEHLKYISRQLPAPDGHLYLQNAQDLVYSAGVTPEKLVAERNTLNERRSQAIQRFLATQTFSATVSYQVAVHDFAPPGIPANIIVGNTPVPVPILGAENKLNNNFQGKLPASSGFGSGPAPISQ